MVFDEAVCKRRWVKWGWSRWTVGRKRGKGLRWRLQVGVGGCGYCGLWRGVRGSAATRATRCSVGMVRAAAA